MTGQNSCSFMARSFNISNLFRAGREAQDAHAATWPTTNLTSIQGQRGVGDGLVGFTGINGTSFPNCKKQPDKKLANKTLMPPRYCSK